MVIKVFDASTPWYHKQSERKKRENKLIKKIR